VYSSLKELERWDRTYGIVSRMGFDSAEEAWDANPLIGGSVYPIDFGAVQPGEPVCLRRSRHFLLSNRGGQFWLHARDEKVEPTSKHISRKDAEYLLDCGHEFENACVWDFGVGVFQKP
jgi:hypothetical protein